MKTSKSPVEFANRADMIELDSHAFSVCAHIPERAVILNLYAGDGTRVLEMNPDEAQELGQYLIDQAREVCTKTADEDYMRQLNRQLLVNQLRERNERGE